MSRLEIIHLFCLIRMENMRLQAQMKTQQIYQRMLALIQGTPRPLEGSLIVQGGFGKLVNINSTNLIIPWQLDILGDYSIDYASIQNTTNINNTGPPIAPLHTQNLLGNTGFDFSNAGPVWIGSQDSLNWSDPNNWNGGFTPGIGDIASFNGSSSLTVIIDPAFSGTIAGLKHQFFLYRDVDL